MKKTEAKLMEQELKKAKAEMSSRAKMRGREAGLPERWVNTWADVWTDIMADAWTDGYKKAMEQSVDLFLTIAEQLKAGKTVEQIAKQTGAEPAIIKKIETIRK